MAVRRVYSIFEPDDVPALRKRARVVDSFDAPTKDLIDDLLDTWAAHSAYGIAAPQIGVHRRVVVVKLEPSDEPLVLVNPKITRAKGQVTDYDGCLSIPGIYADTPRAERIHVEAQDQFGERLSLDVTGFDARIVQHEIDHLEGVLFIDRLEGLTGLYRLSGGAEAGEPARVPLTPEQLDLIKKQQRELPPPALRLR